MGKELALYVDIVCIQGSFFVKKYNIVVGLSGSAKGSEFPGYYSFRESCFLQEDSL